MRFNFFSGLGSKRSEYKDLLKNDMNKQGKYEDFFENNIEGDSLNLGKSLDIQKKEKTKQLKLIGGYLASHGNIKKLVLLSNELSDSDLKQLFPSLQDSSVESINLACNKITSKGAIFLLKQSGKFKNLQFINFDLNKIGDKAVVDGVKILCKMKQPPLVNWGWNKITKEAQSCFENIMSNKICNKVELDEESLQLIGDLEKSECIIL
jgi:hypothetical protein